MSMPAATAVVPPSSCWQSPRIAPSSASLQCVGAPTFRSWSSGASSWQGGIRLGAVAVGPPSNGSSVGQQQQSRRRGGVARSEQVEVGTSTTTSAPSIELNERGVTEVDKDTFWPIVQSADDKVVVLDMYTQWCGPCKLMLPKIIQLAEKLDDVIFLKIDCNQHNKSLAKELGIRVVPTFKIFKNKELAGEVAGAKFPDLVSAIEKVRKGEPIK